MSTVPTPELPHPIWCTREACDVRGWHGSRRLIAYSVGSPTEPIVCQLVQLVAIAAEPYITIGRDTDQTVMAVGIRQAVIVRRFLGRLTELAKR